VFDDQPDLRGPGRAPAIERAERSGLSDLLDEQVHVGCVRMHAPK